MNEITSAQMLDASIFEASLRPTYRVATVTTDYGSVIDFTKLSDAEKYTILSEPTFLDSIIEKTFSHHRGGVFLPAKSARTNRSEHEEQRLAIWRINKKLGAAKAA